MPFDPWRGLRPWYRRPVVRPGDNRFLVYADAYALPVLAAVLVVFGVTLAAVLIAGRNGGSARRNAPLSIASATRVAPPSAATGATTPSSADAMTIHGVALAAPGGQPVPRPDVQVAVEGGDCSDYTVADSGPAPGDAFTIALPGGCAAAGARIYFRVAAQDQAGAPPQALEPACVSSGGAFSGSLAYAPGADAAVQLQPGCADQPSSLSFVPGRAAAPANAADLSPALVLALEPGVPGGIPAADQYDLAAYTPGLPGGILVADDLGGASTAAGAPPQPPLVSGMPNTAATPQAGVAVVPPAAQPAPASPPITAANPAGGSVVTPPIASNPAAVSPPASVPAPPVFSTPPPTDGSAATIPAPGAIGTLPASSTGGVMTLDVTVVDAQGQSVAEPRAQVYFAGALCADETAAAKDDATVRLTLPGTCLNLAAGATLAFRAAGFDPSQGPVVQPLAACSTDEAGTLLAVTYQPGASEIPVRLTVGAQGSPTDCPAAPAATAPSASGGMMLSVSVRAADHPDLFASPAVRVYAGAQPCGEASSSGSLVVHVTLPAGCGQPGDVLSFEAGGIDSSGDQQLSLAPACSFELVFGQSAAGVPAYQPVTLAPGANRFVPLILGALDGCPAPGAPPATQPGTQPATGAMTLTLSIVDPALPQAPLERPAVTALVGGKPCARGASIDTQSVVIALPQACGAAGAAVSFTVSALDPRYTQSGDTPACAVDPPQPTDTARTYRPTPRPVAFQPGASPTYSLLPSAGPCPGAAPATPSATSSAAPTPTATAGPRTPTPGAAAPAVSPARATPSPQATLPPPTPAPTPEQPTPFIEPVQR